MAYVPPHQRNRAANPQADGEKDGARAVDSRGGYPSGDRDRGGKGEGRWNREGQEDAPAPPRRRGGGPVSAMAEGNGGDWRRRQDGRRSNSDEKKPTEVEIFGEIQSRSSAGIDFDNYDAIPVQLTGTNVQEIKPITRFSEAKLTDSLFDNLRRCGYDRPTPVQKHSIPIVVSGRDLMACAQTGSGKTCAFMVPCIESLLRSGPPANPSSRRPKPMPCGLVLAPTRELALQIHGESAKFAFDTGILCRIVYGGADIKEQREDLEKGCDILIATPGRLTDMGQRHMVELDLVQFFILDEADRMLDMGFEPQIRKILREVPSKRHTLFFTATWPKEVRKLAEDFLYNPYQVQIGNRDELKGNQDITQVVKIMQQYDKSGQLLRALQEHQLAGPANPQGGKGLVFSATKRGADQIEQQLRRAGVASAAIHGDKDQRQRDEALDNFRSGRVSVLVATDVAARGLDVKGVTLVVNFDPANNAEDYVHRIGRTGRAGQKGTAITFLTSSEGNKAKGIIEVMEKTQQVIGDDLRRLASTVPDKGAGKSRFNNRDRSSSPKGKGKGKGGKGKDRDRAPPARGRSPSGSPRRRSRSRGGRGGGRRSRSRSRSARRRRSNSRDNMRRRSRSRSGSRRRSRSRKKGTNGAAEGGGDNGAKAENGNAAAYGYAAAAGYAQQAGYPAVPGYPQQVPAGYPSYVQP
mmetsp:Transcript_19468/g.45256  ORF Transcript_19468/g.45256 Transcript_19468/m.45256 type:complete len:692 (+) Transcript_19468:76-2151(+)